MENKKIALILEETADLMEIAGVDGFRIRSYRNAAQTVENFPEPIIAILEDSKRNVTDIKGIGQGIASALENLIKRGSFQWRDEMLEKYPPTALELLKINGLGPKSIAVIYHHFRASTVDSLEQLCRDGKIRDLPRMGQKFEERILRGIQNYKKNAGLFLINFANQIATDLINYLSTINGIENITIAGSLRRGKEIIGDVDLLISGPKAVDALDRFVEYPSVRDVLTRGTTKASATVGPEGLQVDVRVLKTDSYGAALQYFTGSKAHNIALRDRAARMGFRLNEYGLYSDKDGRKIVSQDEASIYEALELPWIPPELRENTGEIEVAVEGSLPTLIKTEQIISDLHVHTNETDGSFPINAMAEAARTKGYQYIAITDHSKALAMANGLDENRLLDQIERIRKTSEQWDDFTILSGCEVDILKDGKLDIDDEVLAQLDVVIASVHSHMHLEANKMTDRLLKVLENPYVNILGHPTGRLLLRREPYVYDFEQVINEAGKRNIHIEINASPERLDLGAAHLRIAKSNGVKFVISTDAHHTRHFDNMRYGVMTARRGWLTSDDVLNTLTLGEFRVALARQDTAH